MQGTKENYPAKSINRFAFRPLFLQTMQRTPFVIFLSLLTILAWAQERTIEIQWSEPQIFSSDQLSISVPSFEGAVHSLPETIVPEYCDRIAVPYRNVEEVSLTDMVTAPLTDRELSTFSRREERVSEDFDLSVSVAGKAKQSYLSFCLTTIRRSPNGQLEKTGFCPPGLVSFC